MEEGTEQKENAENEGEKSEDVVKIKNPLKFITKRLNLDTKDNDWKFGIFFVVTLVILLFTYDIAVLAAWAIIYILALSYFDKL